MVDKNETTNTNVETDDEFLEKMYLADNKLDLKEEDIKAEKLNKIWYRSTKGISRFIGRILNR